MLEQLDVEVLRLVRVAIGPLVLGQLRKGGVRSLTVQEKQAIDQAMQNRVSRRLSLARPVRAGGFYS